MAPETSQRPNVLCFVADQHRQDHMGCAGNPLIRTPNMDRLAASGVRFERCYVNNPICSPSRATMWTGLSVRGHRMRANGMSLDKSLPTVPGALAAAGYRAHGVGKFHLTPFQTKTGVDSATLAPSDYPESRDMWGKGRLGQLPMPYYGLQSAHHVSGHGDFFWGEYRDWLLGRAPEVVRAIDAHKKEKGESWESTFKSYVPAELHHSRWIADLTVDFLRTQARTGQPFFCWTSFPDPHHPYHAPDPYFSMYDPAEMPEPNRREGELANLAPHYTKVQTERWPVVGMPTPLSRYYHRTPEIMARTYAMVSNVDANVGRVMDALEELGIRENTIIVYLSDHGDLMGDHWLQQKGPFHFDGLVRVPFLWSWPAKVAGGKVVSSLASMLDFAPTILDLCGVPIPENPSRVKAAFGGEPPAWPGHSLRPILEGSAEKVRDTAFIDHDDDASGLRARTLVTERYRLTVYAGETFGELFDLREDPKEQRNLWADQGARGLRAELTERLLHEAILSDCSLPRMISGS